MKTLVCIIGQIRIPELTWDAFKVNVLDELGADLALAIHDDGLTNRDNEYFKNAKYVFEYKNTSGCWASAFDQMNPGWRSLVDIPGDWIAPVKEPIERKGSGGVLAFIRWWLYQNIEKLVTNYDRVIVTRSDYMWTSPHPTLDNEHIWLPNGEFHGGLPDRYFAFPVRLAKEVLTVGSMEDVNITGRNLRIMRDQRLREGHGHFLYNDEGFIFVRFIERGLIESLGFFQMNMFLASDTRGNPHPSYGVRVVYPDELATTEPKVTWPFYIEHRHVSQNGMFNGRLVALTLSESK